MADYCFSIVVDKMARAKTSHTSTHMTNIFNGKFGTCFFACKWLEKRLGNLGK
jgi:hypothetical protein